jgi:hypothetical protein
MQKDEGVSNDGFHLDRTKDRTIGTIGIRSFRTISPPDLPRHKIMEPRRDAPFFPNHVPIPAFPRWVLNVSKVTQQSTPDESFGQEHALVSRVQVDLQRTHRVLRRQNESGIERGVHDLQTHWCVAGASRDLIVPSGRDLLLGLGVDCDETEICVDRARDGGDINGRSKLNTGRVTDHGDVHVDDSRLGLEYQLARDGKVPTDGTVGNPELAKLAPDVLRDVGEATFKQGCPCVLGGEIDRLTVTCDGAFLELTNRAVDSILKSEGKLTSMSGVMTDTFSILGASDLGR